MIQNTYIIEDLNVDDIVDKICDNADIVFPKNSLWGEKNRSDYKTTSIIDWILANKKLSPPLISFIDGNNPEIADGNHRIALCRYLSIKKIPFLLEKKFII